MNDVGPKPSYRTTDFWVGLLSPAMVAIALLGILPTWLSRAWVLALLWRWYAVPLGLPALAFASAFGALLLVRLATSRAVPDSPHGYWRRLLDCLVTDAAYLLFGWLGLQLL